MDSRTDKKPKGSNDIFSEENLTDDVGVIDTPINKTSPQKKINNDLFTEDNLKKKGGGGESTQMPSQSELISNPQLPLEENKRDTIFFDNNNAYQKVGGSKEYLPQPPKEPYKGFFGIDVSAAPKEFNQQFENITGYKGFDLTEPTAPQSGSLRGLLGSDLQKKREETFEDKKFNTYTKEAAKIDELANKVHGGVLSLDGSDIVKAAENPFSQNIVKSIVAEYKPEAATDLTNPQNAAEASFAINAKNRINSVKAREAQLMQYDAELKNDWGVLQSDNPPVGVDDFTKETVELKKNIPIPNLDDNKSISSAISKLQELQNREKIRYMGLPLAAAKSQKETENLIGKLKSRIGINTKDVSENISWLNDNIQHAVVSHAVTDNKDEPENDEARINQFKLGLSAIEYSDPVLFKNVTESLAKKSKVAPTDYSYISEVGQGIYNRNIFKSASISPDFLGKGTNFDYTTFEEKKAKAAGDIGEWMKAKGIKNTFQFSDKSIMQAANELGIDKNIAQKLALEEALPAYDAIPKSGALDAIVQGMEQPIEGILSTVEGLSETPAETYLRSKQLSGTGMSQKVPTDTGYDAILQSEKGKFWTGALQGMGQFLTQVALAKGAGVFGGGAAKALNLGVKGTEIATIYGGTALPIYLQTYGQSYEQFLNQNGDPAKSSLMAHIASVLETSSELWLPDVKIANMAAKGLRDEAVDGIFSLIKKGGDPADIALKTQSITDKFLKALGKTANIGAQEIGEEVYSQIGGYVSQSILDPNSALKRDLNDEVWQTIKQTALSMALPSILGGAGNVMQKDFTVQTLHNSAINFDEAKEGLEKQLDKGLITQDELNNSIKLLATHKQSIESAPDFNANGDVLNSKQKLDYALEDTKIKVYDDKIKNTTGVQKEMWEQKKKASEDAQRKILIPETKTGTPEEITQPIELSTTVPNEESQTEAKVSNATEKASTSNEAVDNVSQKTESGAFEDKVRALYPALKNTDDAGVNDFVKENATDTPSKFINDFGQDKFNEVVKNIPTKELQSKLDIILDNNPDSKDVDVLDKIISDREKETQAEQQPIVNSNSEVDKPNLEQQLKDLQEGNTVIFTYDKESDVPEVFKDKISSTGETNGKKFVRVTVAKSLADYELNRNADKQNKPTISKEQTEPTIKEVEGVSSNSNEGVEIDKNKTHFELSDNELIMVRSDGSKQLYSEYKDLDEANSDLQRLNAEYQGYENKYPIIKVVKDNVGLSTAEIEVKKRGGNNLIKPNGDGKYKVVEVSNINKEAFDKLKSDYDRNVSLSEKDIEIQKLTDALDRTNTPIQIKKLNDAIAKAKEERENIQNQSSLTKPINETTTTEVSPTIPTEIKEPKGQGNKEPIQPSTESVGRPNAEAEATVLKPKKDLGQRAREEAAKYREGKKSVLPDFLKAKLPEGTKLSGIDINEAWAKALETFADVHDATKDFAKAIDEGFKHIKDWFDENKVPYNEKELKDGFKGEMGEPENISGKGNKPPIEGNDVVDGEEGGKTGQRRFTKQVLADEAILPKDQIAKRLDYVVRTNEITINEATKIINDIGVDEAYDVVVGNRDVHPAVRTTMGQMLIKKFNNLASQAKDEGTKNYYWDKTIDIANFVSEKLGTEAGQSIQAFSLYSRLSPEAQLRGAIKQVKEQSASNKKKSERDVNNIGDKFKKVNEETAETITKSKKVKDGIENAENKRVASAKNKIQKARERRDKIIKKYKSEKGKNLYSGVGLTKEGIEFVGDLAKTYIDEGIANLQILAEKIKENLKSVSGKDIPDDVNNHITSILKPLVEVAENTKIAKSFKELEKDIHTVIKEHYTVPEETKTTLINKFMDKVGLEESDAKELAKVVEEEFDKTATRRKEDILEKEKARFERIQNKLGGAKKVEKKTLQAEAIRFSNLGAFDNNQLLEMLSEKLGTGQLTAEQGKEIQRLAERIEKAPEGRPKNEATEDLLTYRASIKGTNWAEVAQGVWYANVLSGMGTHIKNIVSTGMNGFAFFSVEAARDPKSIPFLLYGGAKGFKRGAIEAGHTLKTGRSPIHVSKIELPNILERVEFKGGYLNPANYLKFVGRLMVGEDVLQFQGLKEMRATQLAYREAKKMGYKNPFNKKVWDVVNDRLLDTPERYNEASEQAKLEGVSGREAKRRIYELMEQSRPIKMTEDAYGFAAKGTFNHATEGTLGALTNWISKGLDMDVGGARPLRFLVPFTRIITNVANNTLDFSPIGLVRAARGTRGFEGFKKSQLFKDQYHVMTKEERQQTLAKASLGILSMAGLYALAALGKVEVTGSGPDDIKKKLQLMQGGWQDYSIKIGDKYYSYKLTPMVFAWGVIGSIRDHQNYDKSADEETILQRTALAAWDGIKNIGDMTWVNSAAPIMGALSSNNPGEASALLGNVGRNVSKSFLIPNAYTQSAQRVQNIFNMPQKQANNAFESLIMDVPIARNTLNDKINALGDPIVRDVDVLVSQETKDPVFKYLLDKKGWVAPVNKNTLIVFDFKTQQDRPVTDDEYYEFSKLRGSKIKEGIADIMKNGAMVKTGDTYIVKSAQELTSAELNKLLTPIKTKATKETKQELFSGAEGNF